jgi:hypothetical protein
MEKVPFSNSYLVSYMAGLALLKEYVDVKYSKDTGNALIERMDTYNLVHPVAKKYDISEKDQLLMALDECMNFYESSTSGAAFGGALSGAGTNQQVNDTGLAGIDKPLKDKKKTKKNDK